MLFICISPETQEQLKALCARYLAQPDSDNPDSGNIKEVIHPVLLKLATEHECLPTELLSYVDNEQYSAPLDQEIKNFLREARCDLYEKPTSDAEEAEMIKAAIAASNETSLQDEIDYTVRHFVSPCIPPSCTHSSESAVNVKEPAHTFKHTIGKVLERLAPGITDVVARGLERFAPQKPMPLHQEDYTSLIVWYHCDIHENQHRTGNHGLYPFRRRKKSIVVIICDHTHLKYEDGQYKLIAVPDISHIPSNAEFLITPAYYQLSAVWQIIDSQLPFELTINLFLQPTTCIRNLLETILSRRDSTQHSPMPSNPKYSPSSGLY